MNSDDIPHPKFTGRTYGRPQVSQASRVFDEVVSGETISFKQCLAAWNKDSSHSECEDFGSFTGFPKISRMDTSEGDSFSFDSVKRISKSMRIKHKVPTQKVCKQKKQIATLQSCCEPPQKLVTQTQLGESAMKTSAAKRVLLTEVRFTDCCLSDQQSGDFQVNNYFKDSIPDEKPSSPLMRKSRCQTQRKASFRNLTLCEPALNENYNTNYTQNSAEQLSPSTQAEQLSTSTQVPNKSLFLKKQELDSEEQGLTINCKLRCQLEKSDMWAECDLGNLKNKVNLVEESHSLSQDSLSANGSNDSIYSPTYMAGDATSLNIYEHRNVLSLEDLSSKVLTSLGTSNSLSPTSVTYVNKMADCNKTKATQPSKPSASDRSSLDESQELVRRQYRIFKSRSAQMEKKLQASTFTRKKCYDLLVPCSKPVTKASDECEVISQENNETVSTAARERHVSVAEPMIISQISDSSERGNAVEYKLSCKCGNNAYPTTRSSLAALPSYIKQDIHLESTSIQDSISEPSLSQDTTSNSQSSLGGESMKKTPTSSSLAALPSYIKQNIHLESTSVQDTVSEPSLSQDTMSNSQSCLAGENMKKTPAYKFFKSKKLSHSLDSQKRIFVRNSQEISARPSYNIRSWNSDQEGNVEEQTMKNTKKKKKDHSTDVVVLQKSEDGPKLKREIHWPEGKHDTVYTTLTVSKSHRQLYTVIQNVRQIHEVQELGETHDFIKEIDYLLESLKRNNSMTVRCLSCLQLVNKCISPAFRMHMRVHGTVSRIFNLLEDACSDPSLALSTSAIMFMLSQDQLSMDLDHCSLSLMLKLLEMDASIQTSLDESGMQGLEKTRRKVMELLELLQESCARDIDVDSVSTSSLALESLFSLTSRRAGEWLKNELKSAGALDHIVDSVRFCEKRLPNDLSENIQRSLPVLRKLNRCLRVLENISYTNSENQKYLILYKNNLLLQSCSRILRLCQQCLPTFELPESLDKNRTAKDLPGYAVLTCLLNVLRVMINMTHNSLTHLDPAEELSLMETIFKCLNLTLAYIPLEQRFDLAVQCLVLLTNLVEQQETCRTMLMEMRLQVRHTQQSRSRTVGAVSTVVNLFVQRSQIAQEMEEEIESISASPASASPSLRLSDSQKEADTSDQQANHKQRKQKKLKMKSNTVACGAPTKERVNQHREKKNILEECEETLTTALHKAGKHMENSIVAAYAAILLGSLISNNKEYTSVVKKLLPNGDFGPLITVLEKFLSFMILVMGYEHTDVDVVKRVIRILMSAS